MRHACTGARSRSRVSRPHHALGVAWLLLAAATSFSAEPAVAADIRVLCPSVLRAPMIESARLYARASGDRIEFVFGSVAAVRKRVATGERADVAIGTLAGADALVRLGRGLEGSVAPLVQSVLALAVARHAAVTEMRDAEALAGVLRNAESIVMPDAGLGVPGGAQAAELLERLGLAEALRPRIRLVASAQDVSRRVASGEAELGVALMSDLVQARGIVVLGPLLEPQMRGIAYAALVPKQAAERERARNFIAHLREPQARSIFRKAGYLPLD